MAIGQRTSERQSERERRENARHGVEGASKHDRKSAQPDDLEYEGRRTRSEKQRVDRGGAQRLLATLHAQLPRVPFLTGWVTRSDAVGWAERALQIEPDHPGSKYVLALTLLETGPEGRRGEAIALMEQAAAAEPRAGMILEDLATRESAREHLSKLDL